MTNVIEIRSHADEYEYQTTLNVLCSEGARAMLDRALDLEVAEYPRVNCVSKVYTPVS